MEGAQLSDFYYNRTFMSNVRSKMEMGLSGAEKPETNLFFIFRTV